MKTIYYLRIGFWGRHQFSERAWGQKYQGRVPIFRGANSFLEDDEAPEESQLQTRVFRGIAYKVYIAQDVPAEAGGLRVFRGIGYRKKKVPANAIFLPVTRTRGALLIFRGIAYQQEGDNGKL